MDKENNFISTFSKHSKTDVHGIDSTVMVDHADQISEFLTDHHKLHSKTIEKLEISSRKLNLISSRLNEEKISEIEAKHLKKKIDKIRKSR